MSKPADSSCMYGCVGIGFLLLIVFVVSVISNHGAPLPSRSDQQQAEVFMPSAWDAYDGAQQMVLKKLKAPSSAKFPDMGEANIEQLTGGKWKVSAYVDSQNSFGAMLRSNFTVTLAFNGKAISAYPDDVIIDDN